MAKSNIITTGLIRLNHTQLLDPLVSIYDDSKTYSTEILINKRDAKTLGLINTAMDEIIKSESEAGGKFTGITPDEVTKLKTEFLKDGDAREDKIDAYKGTFYMKAKTKTGRPAIQAKDSNEPITSPMRVYDGVGARVLFELGSYLMKDSDTHKLRKGFYAKLIGVQIVRDMDTISNKIDINNIIDNDEEVEDLW